MRKPDFCITILFNFSCMTRLWAKMPDSFSVELHLTQQSPYSPGRPRCFYWLAPETHFMPQTTELPALWWDWYRQENVHAAGQDMFPNGFDICNPSHVVLFGKWISLFNVQKFFRFPGSRAFLTSQESVVACAWDFLTHVGDASPDFPPICQLRAFWHQDPQEDSRINNVQEIRTSRHHKPLPILSNLSSHCLGTCGPSLFHHRHLLKGTLIAPTLS